MIVRDHACAEPAPSRDRVTRPDATRPGVAAASARRTCSSVTTPRRRSSRSTTISAPSERRPSERQELLDRGVVVDAEGLVAVRVDHVGDRAAPGWPSSHGAVDPLLVQQPEEAPEAGRRPGTTASGSAGRTRPGPASTVVSPGTETGWVSMTSATVTPSRRSEKRLETTAPRRRLAEEPAHEDPPDPAAGVAADEQEDAEAHEDVGEALAEARGEARRRGCGRR